MYSRALKMRIDSIMRLLYPVALLSCALIEGNVGSNRANGSLYIICAIAFQEDLYIDEWIQYHKLLGFDAIQILDNSDDNSLMQLTDRYPSFIAVKHFPGQLMQLPAFNLCVTAFKNERVWAAFIDIDEFIVLRQHNSIGEFINDCGSRGGSIGINWLEFGSNSRLQYENIPVLRRFTARRNKMNEHIKSITYLPHVVGFTNPHYPVLLPGKEQYSCNSKAFTGPVNWERNDSIAAIHHYFTRSEGEWDIKRARGRTAESRFDKQGKSTLQGLRDHEEFHDRDYNSVEDFRAWDFFNTHTSTGMPPSASEGGDGSVEIESSQLHHPWQHLKGASSGHFGLLYDVLDYTSPSDGVCSSTEVSAERERGHPEGIEVSTSRKAQHESHDLLACSQHQLPPLSLELEMVQDAHQAGVNELYLKRLKWQSNDDPALRLAAYCLDSPTLSRETCLHVLSILEATLLETALTNTEKSKTDVDLVIAEQNSIVESMRRTVASLYQYHADFDLLDWEIVERERLEYPLRKQRKLISKREYWETKAWIPDDLGAEDPLDIPLPCHKSWDKLISPAGLKLYVVHVNQSAFEHSNESKVGLASLIQPNEALSHVVVPQSVLGHAAVFRDVLPWREAEWSDAAYVGIVPGSLLDSHAALCTQELLRLLGLGAGYNFDVIPLSRSKRSLLVGATIQHSRAFKVVWDGLLQGLGYDSATIRQYDHVKPFFDHALLIKPVWLRKLAGFMNRAMDRLLLNVTLHSLCYAPQNVTVIRPGLFDAERMSGGENNNSPRLQTELDEGVHEGKSQKQGQSQGQGQRQGQGHEKQSPTAAAATHRRVRTRVLFDPVLELLPSFYLLSEGAHVCHANRKCPYSTER